MTITPSEIRSVANDLENSYTGDYGGPDIAMGSAADILRALASEREAAVFIVEGPPFNSKAVIGLLKQLMLLHDKMQEAEMANVPMTYEGGVFLNEVPRDGHAEFTFNANLVLRIKR